MCEILQNVKFQIEESGELIGKIIFTGGGSRLKNFELLIEEYLPEFRVSIACDPQLAFECLPGVNTIGVFTTALYGLMNQGKDNCCECLEPTPVNNGGALFGEEEMNGKEPEEPVKKPEEKKPEEPKKNNKKGNGKNKSWGFGTLFGGFKDTMEGFIKTATSEDPEEQDSDNDE